MTAPKGKKRKSRAMDPDIKAIKGALRALSLSTTERMQRANLRFIADRYGYVIMPKGVL